MNVGTRLKDFQIKACVENEACFIGYGSTYGNKDRDGDIFVAGAWTKSIAAKSIVPMLFNHNRDSVIGKFEVSEDEKGLFVKGTLNMADPIAANVKALIDMGALDSMSVGFIVKDWEAIDPLKPYGAWNIKEAELVECSIVTIPANTQALIQSIKSLTEDERTELAQLRVDKAFALLNKTLDTLEGELE